MTLLFFFTFFFLCFIHLFTTIFFCSFLHSKQLLLHHCILKSLLVVLLIHNYFTLNLLSNTKIRNKWYWCRHTLTEWCRLPVNKVVNINEWIQYLFTQSGRRKRNVKINMRCYDEKFIIFFPRYFLLTVCLYISQKCAEMFINTYY